MIRDEKIKLIKHLKYNQSIGADYTITDNDADEIIKALEQSLWIPCSERLPEETGTYMTTIDYGECGLVLVQKYYYGKRLKWDDDCVIAWMPLPQPYVESVYTSHEANTL